MHWLIVNIDHWWSGKLKYSYQRRNLSTRTYNIGQQKCYKKFKIDNERSGEIQNRNASAYYHLYWTQKIWNQTNAMNGRGSFPITMPLLGNLSTCVQQDKMRLRVMKMYETQLSRHEQFTEHKRSELRAVLFCTPKLHLKFSKCRGHLQ